MTKTSLILGLTSSLAFGGMLLAQRGGIDPAAIATALPLEGAPLAVAGPYKIESGPAFNSPGHVVYRRQRLRAVHQRELGDEIERSLVRSADQTTHGVIRTRTS